MEQTTVGIREFKARLSRYLRQVKGGATLVITERGKPIGRIVPIVAPIEDRMQLLMEAGTVSWNGRKLAPKGPVARARGDQTVASLLLEDRE